VQIHPKNPKKTKETKKKQKNPLSWVFLKKNRVFSNPASEKTRLEMPTTSSFRMAAVVTWRLRSGKARMDTSPRLVRKTMQFSACGVEVSVLVKVTALTLRTRAPSWAVSLYLPQGFRLGNRNALNCSSLAMRTLCGDANSVCVPEHICY
jgi:hypothetical protein